MVLCLVFFGVFLWKTSPGLEMQIVGQNNRAAAYAGINVQKNTLAGHVYGGAALPGLPARLRFWVCSTVCSRAWPVTSALTVWLWPCWEPATRLACSLRVFLLGAMKSGGNAIQMFTPVPSSVVDLIRALVIVFVLVNVLYRVTEKVKQHKKEKKGVSANV